MADDARHDRRLRKARGEPWEVRHEFEGRPALFALLGLIVGLTAVTHPFNLLALLGLFWLRSLPGRAWCAAFFVIGLAIAPQAPIALDGRQFVSDTGVVSGPVHRDGPKQTCEITLNRGVFGLMVINGPLLKLGDRISVGGVASPLEVSEEGLERQMMKGTLKAGAGDVTIVANGGPVAGVADQWRQSFQSFAEEGLPPEPAATVTASVFGVDDVSPKLIQRLRAAGAISLASVSGLQVLLIGAFVMAVLGRLPLVRGGAIVVLACALLVYATATGLHPGVIRASLMMVFLCSAYLLRRDPDILSALAISAVLELLWRRVWVYDFGFQMSFVVVAMLALWLPSRNRLSQRPFVARVLFALAGIVVMFVTAAPLVAYQTGELNFRSPLTGVLIVPAVPPMFALAVCAWALGFVSSSVGLLWIKWLVAPFAGWILACSDLAARWHGASVSVPVFSGYWLVLVYVLVAMGARITASAFAGARS